MRAALIAILLGACTVERDDGDPGAEIDVMSGLSCDDVKSDIREECRVAFPAGASRDCSQGSECDRLIMECIHDVEPSLLDVCALGDDACSDAYFETRSEWRAATTPECVMGLSYDCPPCP